MCIGTDFAMVGLSMITDEKRRGQIRERLAENGRTVIDLSAHQVAEFSGNAIELQSSHGRLLALSARALKALRPHQLAALRRGAELLALDVPTLELAGGSVRCMLAGIHLSARPKP